MSYGTVQAEKMTTESGYSLGAGNASSFKNRIINGAMMIDQRNAGASVTPSATEYTLDRFRLFMSVGSKLSVQQVVDAPTGFAYSSKITVASSYSPSSSEQFFFGTSFEANNIGDLSFGTASAKTATLSFWVKSSVTGTYSASWTNDANNRSYVQTFTISSADTWEQKTITIVGDTTGTWTNYGNTRNSLLQISLGAGSNYYGTAGSWQSGNLRQTSGSTNFVSQANGSTFYITGVQLEVGTVATSFDYRPYGTELQLCQRYYYQVKAGSDSYCQFGMGRAYSGTAGNGIIPFAVPMRSSPTFAYLGTVSNYDFSPTSINSGAVDAGYTHMTVGMGFTSITSGSIYIIGQNAASTPCGFTFSAEL